MARDRDIFASARGLTLSIGPASIAPILRIMIPTAIVITSSAPKASAETSSAPKVSAETSAKTAEAQRPIA